MLHLLVAFAVTQSSTAGPTLSGVVRDDAGGPISVATVFIRTAAPRKGVGVL